MIRKLAEELASNDIVGGTNDIRPLEEPAAPADKPSADYDTTRYGFTDHANERNNQGQAGVLSRVLANYKSEAGKHQDDLVKHLGDHVKKLTGSTAMSRSAMQRSRASSGD